MTITLYITSSEKNALYKKLTNGTVITGTLRKDTSVSNPIIDIAYTSDIVAFNYVYIEEFNRYYYVSDIRSIRDGIWQLALKVDVLMSFKNDILNSVAILAETTDRGKTRYLPNDVWTNKVKDKTDIINFNSGLLSSGEYILITAGG